MQISRRGTLFGLLAFAGSVPAPGLAEAFDYSVADEVADPPAKTPPLFGTRERSMGRPDLLFPRAAAAQTADAPIDPAWVETVDGLRPFGAKGQIAGVNSFVNNTDEVHAMAAPGRTRRWASALQFLRSDGASEDYAIAKYAFLHRLGFHRDRLRMVWVAERPKGGRHAVLAVNLGAQSVVLEHRFVDVTTDAMLADYVPFASLTEQSFSIHWDPAEGKGVVASLDRLGKSLRAAGA
jgi:predicted transglutaminase-like cysteine proteinase